MATSENFGIVAESTDHAAYEAIVRRLDPDAVIKRSWPLLGGISAQMTAISYHDGGGQVQTVILRHPATWVLENRTHAAQYEFEVLAAVRAAGVLSPTPHFYDESGDIFVTPFLVIEYLDGAPVFVTADTNGFARQLAEQLAFIHSIDTSQPVFRDMPQLADELNRRMGERTPDETLGETRVLEVLRPVWPLPEVNKPAVLHSDIWAGNLVWRDGRLVGVIDWEDTHIGDPVYEVAVARLDLLWAFGWPMVDAFTDAYREFSSIDFTLLPYWDLVAAVRPAHYLSEWATAWPVVGRPDVDSTTMRRDQREFVNKALAAIAQL